MKKIYTILIATTIGASVNAQSPIITNFTENIVKDMSNVNVYYEKYNQITKNYYLKKLDNSGNSSTLINITFTGNLNQMGNNSSSAVYHQYNHPTYVYNDKAIVRFQRGVQGLYLLYNGTTLDTFVVNNSAGTNLYSPYILSNSVGYIIENNKIYKTNYTTASTSLIFTTPQVYTYPSDGLQVLENNGILYWVDKLTYTKNVLYKYVGGVVSKVDSVSGIESFNLYKDKISGEIYASKNFATSSINANIKFDASGNSTYFNAPAGLTIINPLMLVNHKLIYQTNSSVTGLVAIDVNTNATSTLSVTNPNAITTFNSIIGNGYYSYFIGNSSNDIWVVDGSSANKIGSSINNLNYNRGDFCGDNYYSTAKKLGTTYNRTFVSSPTGSGFKYLNNDSINGNWLPGVSNSSGAYLITSALYKTNCGLQVGINESRINQTLFSLYPNPTKSVLNIELNNFIPSVPITITNALGQMAFTKRLETMHTEIDIMHLKSGIYFLKIGDSQTRKFIKE
jgi:hypothetical protein